MPKMLRNVVSRIEDLESSLEVFIYYTIATRGHELERNELSELCKGKFAINDFETLQQLIKRAQGNKRQIDGRAIRKSRGF